MKKALFLLILAFSISCFAETKTGYKIEINAAQYANDSIFLAGYYNGKIYAFDTLKLDSKGKGAFIDKKELDEGMYLVYISSNKYYDFLLGKKQNISAKIDTTNKSNPFEVAGATQTEGFVAFGKFMGTKHKEQEALNKKLEAAKGDSIKEKNIKAQIKALDNEVIAYQQKIIAENEGEILGLFVKALQAPQFPEDLVNGDMKDRDFLLKRYMYAKKHYWDNFDLADKRSWRINMLKNKLNEYTNKMLLQTPDSIIPEVINLIEKSKKNPDAYNLMCNYMINYSVTSKVMGMDKLMVALAEKYYFTGQAPWADSTIMANIKAEVKKVRYNLLGMTAQNLPLKKYEGGSFNTNELKNKFTLLFFYEPTCGHCKEATPKMHKVYEKFKDKGFDAVAMYIMTDKKEWTDFINEHKLNGWINAWDPDRESYYWHYFDTSTTPGVYLLDKDKKIVAKKIDAESLERILDFELNGKPMTDEPVKAKEEKK